VTQQPASREEPVRVEREEAEPAPAVQHRGKEPAQQKEERHAEAVDEHHEEAEAPVLVAVAHQPRHLHEGHGAVERDAEEHGEGAQRIEVVAPFGHRRRKLPRR